MSIVLERAEVAARPRKKIPLRTIIPYVLLCIGAVFMLFPFVWMISTSLKAKENLFSLSIIPYPVSFSNYQDIFTQSPFGHWIANSLIVAVVTTISVSFFDSIIGYILANFDFAGKKLIFAGILSTLMVPTEMLIIPWYILAVKLGWADTHWGILFPGLISAFGIFLMKQFMKSLPKDLLNAARVDGMSEWGVLFRIVVPLVKPALATLCILTFLGSWNSFVWPLIVTQSEDLYTIPVGLSFFSSEMLTSTSWALIMTGASISVLPLIAVFLIFQKQIIRGVALTGLK